MPPRRPSSSELWHAQASTALVARFHDPVLLAMATVAFGLHATMDAREEIDADLLGRARLPRGHPDRLTSRNTRQGSPERRAVDRIEYLKRQSKGDRELTARQRAGHEGSEDKSPTAKAVYVRLPDGTPTTLYGAQVSRRDIDRVSRYLGLVGRLGENRLDEEMFRRRVRSWQPLVVLGPPDIAGTYRFLDDPGAARLLADLERTAERETWIDSGRGRPPQRRRTR